MIDGEEGMVGNRRIKITGCVVKLVKADMVKGTVRVTLETHLDKEALDNKTALAMWAEYESPVDVELTEQQMQLPLRGPVSHD